MIENLRWSDVDAVRSVISHRQNGICPVCNKSLKMPCLDHQHKKRVGGSGQVRGVICSLCNVMVGKIENNCSRYLVSQKELPQVLRNIADYLEREQYPYLYPSEVEKPKKLKKSSYNALLKMSNQTVPPYPKSGKLTKPLKALYESLGIEPEYYSRTS